MLWEYSPREIGKGSVVQITDDYQWLCLLGIVDVYSILRSHCEYDPVREVDDRDWPGRKIALR